MLAVFNASTLRMLMFLSWGSLTLLFLKLHTLISFVWFFSQLLNPIEQQVDFVAQVRAWKHLRNWFTFFETVINLFDCSFNQIELESFNKLAKNRYIFLRGIFGVIWFDQRRDQALNKSNRLLGPYFVVCQYLEIVVCAFCGFHYTACRVNSNMLIQFLQTD